MISTPSEHCRNTSPDTRRMEPPRQLGRGGLGSTGLVPAALADFAEALPTGPGRSDAGEQLRHVAAQDARTSHPRSPPSTPLFKWPPTTRTCHRARPVTLGPRGAPWPAPRGLQPCHRHRSQGSPQQQPGILLRRVRPARAAGTRRAGSGAASRPVKARLNLFMASLSKGHSAKSEESPLHS